MCLYVVPTCAPARAARTRGAARTRHQPWHMRPAGTRAARTHVCVCLHIYIYGTAYAGLGGPRTHAWHVRSESERAVPPEDAAPAAAPIELSKACMAHHGLIMHASAGRLRATRLSHMRALVRIDAQTKLVGPGRAVRTCTCTRFVCLSTTSTSCVCVRA
jgi:hypothetical protein